MIDTDRDVVFVCSSCSRATRSPMSPINVCPDCGGRVVLRYADRDGRLDHVDGVGGDGTGAATASDGGGPGA